jgi:plasmid stability protein
MASITIRNLEDKLKQHLRVRAAQHGRSLEDEARDILRLALAEKKVAPQDLGLAIRRRFAPLGGSSCRPQHASRRASIGDRSRYQRAFGNNVATRNIADFEGCGIGVIDPWQR